jgi:hypothetical protein
MTATPKARDRVTLARALPDGRTVTHTGMLTDPLIKDGRLVGGQIGGSYWDLDADQMLRLYGVTQTLTVTK